MLCQCIYPPKIWFVHVCAQSVGSETFLCFFFVFTQCKTQQSAQHRCTHLPHRCKHTHTNTNTSPVTHRSIHPSGPEAGPFPQGTPQQSRKLPASGPASTHDLWGGKVTREDTFPTLITQAQHIDTSHTIHSSLKPFSSRSSSVPAP